jgi:hypothetical protein
MVVSITLIFQIHMIEIENEHKLGGLYIVIVHLFKMEVQHEKNPSMQTKMGTIHNI